MKLCMLNSTVGQNILYILYYHIDKIYVVSACVLFVTDIIEIWSIIMSPILTGVPLLNRQTSTIYSGGQNNKNW